MRLDAALEAAEDGNVAGLHVGRLVRRVDAEYDVKELRLHGGQGALAGVDAGHVPGCPSLLGFITSSNVAASCRSVVAVAQPFSDVT